MLLSHSDTLLAVAGAALAVHLIFKRTETHEPAWLVILVLAVPAALTALYMPHASNILYAVLNVFSVYWLTLLTSIVVYRVSPWHPLAKYPGPLICKVSKFYLAFLSLVGKQHIFYANLHQKYGEVVRIGPNELSICDPDAVQPMIGPNGLPKGPLPIVWDGRVPEQERVKPLIAIRDKQEHTRRRRPWTRAFSTAALKGYETIVTSRCVQMVDSLSAEKGTVNLTQWISFFAYDVMNDLAFGGGSEMMRDGDVNGLWRLLEAGQKNAVFMSHVPWLGALFLTLPNLAKDLKAFRAHAKKCAIRRKQQGSAHKDIFHHLMDEDDVATHPPSVVEIVSDGGLAIIAGSDTTSSALTNLFYFLMCNPVAYQRLQREVDELGDDILDCAKQSHLPYLNGAINESLRLFPPVLSGSQRAPEKGSGGRMVATHYIPEGTNAIIPTYSLHRDPRCFAPFADMFLPERWLPEDQRLELEPKIFNSQNEFILNTNAFVPFSLGAANCAGRNLAWMEMRMVVCLMVHRLDMKFDASYNRERWFTDMLDYFVTMKGDLPTILSPRKAGKE
ncbi:cytochrome P450 [Crassisporium funariophilum]|nr:cytochrome P450 [Crassisporium funariophilum]